MTRVELNRATLARQMLLSRERTAVVRGIERLVALQAQLARPPFIGLWSRLEGFRREELVRLIRRREVVRAPFLRGTLHLVSAKDYLALHPVIAPVHHAAVRSILRGRADALDVARLVAEARAYFDEEPRTMDELRDHLAALHPEGDVRAMALAVRMHLPVVQVPAETAWAYPGTADFAPAASWLGAPFGEGGGPRALVLRYLASFGPATATDMQTWSGLTGIKDVLRSLDDQLCTFRDERGRELFDLPDAPRPPADTAAPARFLPDYDNVLLAHDDRTRIIADEHRARIVLSANLRILPTFLVDGFVAGTWGIERQKASATLVIEPFEALSRAAREELAAEGEALLRFIEEDAGAFEVRFEKGGAAKAPAARAKGDGAAKAPAARAKDKGAAKAPAARAKDKGAPKAPAARAKDKGAPKAPAARAKDKGAPKAPAARAKGVAKEQRRR
ncbi:winged helix DNA-binding domain-containing protein [Sorangium sp. So ce542]|uniref:winged helix DNA-binding domain-containing protein n=1 Tax=Sorangium sp. So ce542 TaxID=3133316 RepID=UPI003F5E4335